MAEPAQPDQLIITTEQAGKIFADASFRRPDVETQDSFVSGHGIEVQFNATTLGLDRPPDLPDDTRRVIGNTVWRLCGGAAGCSPNSCGLGDRAMSNDERRQLNCAAANTLPALNNRLGYVLTPTNNDVVFLSDTDSYRGVTALDERGRQIELFRKLTVASTVVVSEHDIPPEGAEFVFNGADSSLGIATTKIRGTRYALIFGSSRPNLGSRGAEDQIVRKGIEGILDRRNVRGLFGYKRRRAYRNMEIRIDIGYSATRKNFAHKVMVPSLMIPEDLQGINLAKITPDQLSGQSQYALTLMLANNLISPRGDILGEITPTMVMDDQYPESLLFGEVFGQYEAENDIDIPRGPEGCPGHGELCHIDYRRITKRTIVGQLVQARIRRKNIHYSDENAIDPANRRNYLASNRLFQLAGVDANKTPRTVNGVFVSFFPRAA